MRFLHTGDLHLGSSFAALPPDKAAVRRREQETLLARIGAAARSERVDLTLIAGDLFDTPHPAGELVRRAAAELARFPGRVLIAPGNHDHLAPDGPYARDLWPGNVTVFRSARLTRVALPEQNAAVWGAAYTGPEQPGPLADAAPLGAGEETTLLLLHGDLNVPHSPYAPVTGAQLRRTGAHYAALGHVHAPAQGRAGDTLWAYCGVPEGRGFDEAEAETPLGVLVGDGCGGRLTLRRVPVAARRVRALTVPLSPEREPLDAICAALPPDSARDLWRVTLTGSCAAPPDLAGLTQALEGRVFYAQLRDETRPPEDLWAGAGDPTLRGRFLAALRQTGADPALMELAARYGLAALTGGEPPEEGGAQ